MWNGIEPGNLADLLMVAITFIATIANILLWFTTRQTLNILVEQVRHQISNSYSTAQTEVVSAHRELFFGILNNPDLLTSFTTVNNLDPKVWEVEKISEFLINQVLIGYVNFTNGIISMTHFDGFRRDARVLFCYESVRRHWLRVRDLHSEAFCQFVEAELLSIAINQKMAPDKTSGATLET